MTKGKMSGWTEMNVTSANNSSNVRQMTEGEVITSCQEKVRQMMTCCQDVVRKLNSVQEHLTSDRIHEQMMPLKEDSRTSDVLVLQEKLHLSAIRINELELIESAMRKKIEDMEEKVQALTAQLLVYKEDFDLERKDREVAHGRIAELEQLLMYQRDRKHDRSGSSHVQNPHPLLPNHFQYQSFELVSRGHDVCDVYETDGVPDIEEQRSITMPAKATKAAGFVDQKMPDQESDGSSMHLAANSFDFCSLFSAVPALRPPAESHLRSSAVPVKGELYADGAEELSARAVTFSDEPAQESSIQVNSKPNFVPEYPGSSNTRSSVSKNPRDIRSFSFCGLDLDEVDFSASAVHNGMNGSMLICPKCRKSFSLSDHCVFLDHLEEC